MHTYVLKPTHVGIYTLQNNPIAYSLISLMARFFGKYRKREKGKERKREGGRREGRTDSIYYIH